MAAMWKADSSHRGLIVMEEEGTQRTQGSSVLPPCGSSWVRTGSPCCSSPVCLALHWLHECCWQICAHKTKCEHHSDGDGQWENSLHKKKAIFQGISVNGDMRPGVSDGRPYESSIVQVWQEFSSLDFQVGSESLRWELVCKTCFAGAWKYKDFYAG